MHVTQSQGINPVRAELPIILTPEDFGGDATLESLIRNAPIVVGEKLHRAAGILFRGFDVLGEDQFQKFAKSFGHPLLSYDFGSTPRTDLGDGVYTSTEYPAHQKIPLHSEQAYTLSWPMKIWFHAIEVAEEGGETPIIDTRLLYQKIDPAVRDRFASKKLRYVRNYALGLDVPWEKVFGTNNKSEVERYCRDNHIKATWLDGDGLRTEQICQAVAKHPGTDEDVWFNQAHLFHVSNLQDDIREALLMIVEGEENLPRNVTYGDGTPIEAEVLDHVREVIADNQVKFPWQAGDILMLDNMLAAHGREKFKGARKTVVAMAEPNG